MRCDGVRPFCSPCIQENRSDDCEYTDNQGRTRTEMLEENIALLEARIQELENPKDADSQILLHDPYGIAKAASENTSVDLGASGRTSSSQSRSIQMLSAPPTQQLGYAAADTPWQELEELPAHICDILVTAFLAYAPAFGFVLSPVRFRVLLDLPTPHPARPHPALQQAVLLWALRLSSIPEHERTWHERSYLRRALFALQEVQGCAPESQAQITWDNRIIAGQHRVHAVQSEVLLAHYFFACARPLEGRYHANAAVALALASGLHRTTLAPPIGSTQTSSTGLGARMLALAPARDALELGERVRVFWAVYVVDRCWSAALGVPCALVDEHIDTPWPRNLEEYEQINERPLDEVAYAFEPSGRSVQLFLAGPLDPSSEYNRQSSIGGGDSQSELALLAKASAVYDAAIRLPATYQGSAEFASGVQVLALVVAAFGREFAQLDQATATPGIRGALAVAHGLAHAAMIHLHGVRAAAGANGAVSSRLEHAYEVLMILEVLSVVETGAKERKIVDPILGIVGTSAAQVLVEEYNHVRCGPQTYASHIRLDALRATVNRAIEALRHCAGTDNRFPIFAQQAIKTEEMMGRVNFQSPRLHCI